MKRKKILIILEVFYGCGIRGSKLKFPTYGLDIINRKNATYTRIVPYLEEEFEIRFSETTPYIGTNKKEKFPIDENWIKKAIDSDEWFAIIPACKKATNTLNKLKIKYDYELPHPSSYQWRKQMILDCKQYLINKRSSLNK
jgi:hypothetical protein